jgi:hypothetical protein
MSRYSIGNRKLRDMKTRSQRKVVGAIPVRAAITWLELAASFFLTTLAREQAAAQSAISLAPNQRLCSIRGKVSDVTTNEGLRKVYLRLIGKSGSYTAVTDDRAKFVFEAVEPGRYVLEAEHQGYIDGQFGDTDGRAVEIKLGPAQSLWDINVRLTPQAVISGRVANEDGDLWTHAQVILYRSEWSHGHRTIRGFSGGDVNDQGEFRIGQIPPGKYYLAAVPDARWETINRPGGKEVLLRQPTWYPNSPDLQGATPIILDAGSQISGLEIRLRRGSTHRIRGTLIGIDNVSTDESHGPLSGRSISAEGTSADAVNDRAGKIGPDGSFEIAGVPSGTYKIRVRQGLPPINLGSVEVQVDDRDVEDVSIQLIPPRSLKGVIQIEEGSLKLAGLTIRLSSVDPGSETRSGSRADGTFDFPLVGSERYRVIVEDNPGDGFYLKQIRYGNAVSNDGTISLTGVNGTLVLLLSTRGARLMGTAVSRATDEQSKSAVSKAQVVLIRGGMPARLGTFDQSGTFAFQDLAPGLYSLYAFEGVPDGAWEDSDFLKELAGAGIEIRLAEGEVKSVDVSVISKSDVAPTLKRLGME